MKRTNITVLLFTHNNNFQGASLALNSLINQTKNPEEIIIVDSSSGNNFYKYKEYTNNRVIKIIYFHNKEKLELASMILRQKALKFAQGKYIVLTEDDGLYVKNFIYDLHEGFENGAELICYKILPNENFLHAEWKFVDEGKFCTIYSLCDYGDKKKKIRANLIFNSFAFSKAAYEKSSGWGTDFFYSKNFFFYNYGGENDLATSIGSYLSANKIVYIPSAIMIHSAREKRMNNKFILFRFSLFGIMKGNKYIEDNFINQNFFISQKLILKFIYVIKIVIIRLFIFLITKFFGSKSWKSWLYRSAIYYYHFKLVKLYYFNNDDLQKFLKNYRNNDWKTFNFNNIKPIKLSFFKPLV
jgi:hypothetical protein